MEESMAFDRAMWRWIEETFGKIEDDLEGGYQWFKKTYGCEVDVHTSNGKLYGFEIVAFQMLDRDEVMFRSDVLPDTILRRNRNIVHMYKTKAVLFHVDHFHRQPNSARNFAIMHDQGMTYPHITAKMWKRPDRKDIAWAIQLRNAVVVELRKHDLDARSAGPAYAVICEAVREIIPLSRVLHPQVRKRAPNDLLDSLNPD
jgi:hypothetical protein